jgi:kinesin family protein C2/C3
MVEVYNERIIDLLNNDTEEAEAENKRAGGRGVDLPGLEVRLGKDGSFVEGLSEWDVAGEEEVLALIEKGQGLRKVASNNINEHSSRSHLVIIVKVYRENFVSGAMTSGYMTLVDLAGSERLKTTGASGQRLREAQHINKSLSSLGDVISALGSGLKHVPYRNSKLTFLLQDSLREKSKVLMFVNISPIPGFSSESVCSLQFAQRCRAVQLGAAASNKIYR